MSDGITTNYLWDELSHYGDVVLETNVSGAATASYVLGNGQLLSQTKNSVTSYFLPDAQGSTRALTTIGGDLVAGQSFYYSAFGQLTDATGAASTVTPNTNYLYTGQQFDSSTGMYSLRARYYAPTSGRFLSRDT